MTQLHNALHQVAIDMARDIDFYPVSVSPETYPDLCSTATGRLPISAMYCEQSIYGVQGNIAQRALHDSLHLALNADFAIIGGEVRVAKEQSRLVSVRYGDTLAAYVWADLYGQGAYLLHFGDFPTDQHAFVLDYLKNGLTTTF